ncbi:MAG: glycerate kinase [Lactovum sp.]
MKFQNKSHTLVLSDSFKSTMSSQEIGKLWNKRCSFDFLPVSDGGEGALEALDSILEGDYQLIKNCQVYIDQSVAYIETAKIVGYDPKKDVYLRNTEKLGEIIQELIEQKILKIIIFIGGTSTNDAGFGLLSALGYDFLDKKESQVKAIPKNFSQISQIKAKKLPSVEIIACTDVKNKLSGKQGATYIYGSQKGIYNHQEIDEQIERLARLINPKTLEIEGTGAGGGIGFALAQFSNFKFMNAYDYISELIDYSKLISHYKKVITGEGRLDSQTINGKLPYRILKAAQKEKVKVEGVFAVVGESELIDSFESVSYIAKNNEASLENFKNTVKNYNNFITKYKYEHGIYRYLLIEGKLLSKIFENKEEFKNFFQKLNKKEIEIIIFSGSFEFKELPLISYQRNILLEDYLNQLENSHYFEYLLLSDTKEDFGKFENLGLDIMEQLKF